MKTKLWTGALIAGVVILGTAPAHAQVHRQEAQHPRHLGG